MCGHGARLLHVSMWWGFWSGCGLSVAPWLLSWWWRKLGVGAGLEGSGRDRWVAGKGLGAGPIADCRRAPGATEMQCEGLGSILHTRRLTCKHMPRVHLELNKI